MSGEKTVTPVMSEGSRSGWPWTRESSDAERGGQGPGQDGLAHAGDVLDQEMADPDRAATTAVVTAARGPEEHSGQGRWRSAAVATASSMDGTGTADRRRLGDPPVPMPVLVLMRSPASPCTQPVPAGSAGAVRGELHPP